MPNFGSSDFMLIFILLIIIQGGVFSYGGNDMFLTLLLFILISGSNFRICDNK